MVRVKLSITTAFHVGWKLLLLIKHPNVCIWNQRFRHSWAAACWNQDYTLKSIPFMLAFLFITVPGIPVQSQWKGKNNARDTLPTKPANILPQTPFHLVLHSKKQAPAVSSVQYLPPLSEKRQDAITRVLLPLTGLRKQVPRHRT